MQKIFFLLIIIISFFTMTTVTFAQQTIRSLDVSPKPAAPTSPTTTSQSPSTQPNSPQPRSPEPDNFSCSRIWVYLVNNGTTAHIALTDPNTPPIAGIGSTSPLNTGNLPANLPAQASLDGATFNPGLEILKTVPVSELPTELEKLGCNIVTVGRTVSISPIIHIYSPANINITLPQSVTFTNYPNYSLLDGVTVIKQRPLYYEVQQDDKLASILEEIGIVYGIVTGKDLKSYLLDQVIPQLQLTNKEQTDFLKLDIYPQLKHISSDNNYQINLIKDEQVNSILPIQIAPAPDTLIRNLLVITPTSKNTFTQTGDLITIKNRVGSTVVENGLILLD